MQRPIVGRLTLNKCRLSNICALGPLKKNSVAALLRHSDITCNLHELNYSEIKECETRAAVLTE
jgi:hypothetical protein